jgi:hypothetical protein
VFALYCAYDVYVGGDVWDGDFNVRANRFVAFVMPLVFVLFNAVLNEALAAWRQRRETPVDSPAGRFAVAAVTAVALLVADGLWLSRQAEQNWRNLAVTDRPPDVERNEGVLAQLLEFRRMIKPGATVASAWAGIPAYFTDYRMIDILGYNDRVVARLPPVAPLTEDDYQFFKPGHVKWSEDRLLREQRPDAFFQIWGVRRSVGPAQEVMPRFGYQRDGDFWVRADSPYVLPVAVQAKRSGPSAADVLDLRRRRRQRRQANSPPAPTERPADPSEPP